MAQSETDAAPAPPRKRASGAPTLREALIIIGGTGLVGVLLGLIPRFGA